MKNQNDQCRFYSCPLEDEHELTAVRYAERNPVRARPQFVRLPWKYRWSSAAAHTAANPMQAVCWICRSGSAGTAPDNGNPSDDNGRRN